jgi:hypothetical protein
MPINIRRILSALLYLDVFLATLNIHIMPHTPQPAIIVVPSPWLIPDPQSWDNDDPYPCYLNLCQPFLS